MPANFAGVGFFECCHGLLVLSRMTRAGADVREAKLVQELAYGALVVAHAKALGDHALQIDPPPAHDAVDGPIRAGLDDLGQFRPLAGGEAVLVGILLGVPRAAPAPVVLGGGP